jgi:hypothetical protein
MPGASGGDCPAQPLLRGAVRAMCRYCRRSRLPWVKRSRDVWRAEVGKVELMASRKGPGGFGWWITFGGLAWHIKRAIDHQQNCPRCRNRDLLSVALDLWHLWGLEGA